MALAASLSNLDFALAIAQGALPAPQPGEPHRSNPVERLVGALRSTLLLEEIYAALVSIRRSASDPDNYNVRGLFPRVHPPTPDDGHVYLARLIFLEPLSDPLALTQSLMAAGWKPSPTAFSELACLAAQHDALPLILWLAQTGSLPPQAASPVYEGNSICPAFARQGPAELAALEALARSKHLVDADGMVGLTDFLASGQFDCAQRLAHLGFKPRTLVIRAECASPGSSAVSACVRARANRRNLIEPAALAQAARDLERDLDFLADQGAPFSFPPPELNATWRQIGDTDPFFAGAMEREIPLALKQAAFQRLSLHGANPNASGAFLGAEVFMMLYNPLNPLNPDPVDSALRLGADPALRPGWTLSGLARWDQSSLPQAVRALDRLIGLGAELSRVPLSCPSWEHPLANAIEWSRFGYASALLDRGGPAAWVSSVTGDTALHLLVSLNNKAALALMERLLLDPSVRAIANHASSRPEWAGHTPLMMACGALNEPMAKALLGAGANPNATDSLGRSALHHAGRKFGAKAQQKCVSLVSLLLSFGADPSLPNHAGLTPGQAMAKRAPLEGLAQLLILRPDDLTGSTESAKQAAASLMARGAQAVSVVESAVLGAHSAPAPAAQPARKRL